MKRKLESTDENSHATVFNSVDNSITRCPYLDTIDRSVLDFDSEKLCSQTLSNQNVYVCLVCGKFFEGRNKSTPAYTHSLQTHHYVLMQLDSCRAYCLPDNYEIIDNSLLDIKNCIAPSFSFSDVIELDVNVSLARDMHGASYLPGFISLNNLNATDGSNVILHLLSHISWLRDYFLQDKTIAQTGNKLLKEFALVMRKLWSLHNFKSTLSPQEFVQALSTESKGKFTIGKRVDLLEQLMWTLNYFQRIMEPKIKGISQQQSIVFSPFHGLVEVTTRKRPLVDSLSEAQQLKEQSQNDQEWIETTTQVPFAYLSVDIPPCPLFRDSHGGHVIPEIPLLQLLEKFDGITWHDSITKEAHFRRKYRILKLPQFLIFHLNRFTKNNFSLEKNPTIVTFPVKNLEMKSYVPDLSAKMTFANKIHLAENEIISFVEKNGTPLHKLELRQIQQSVVDYEERQKQLTQLLRLVEEYLASENITKYDLIANVCHESIGTNAIRIEVGDASNSTSHAGKKQPVRATNEEKAESDGDVNVITNGFYKIHLLLKSTGQWFDMQDLRVTEISPQQIGVSESYLLVYEKQAIV